MSVYQKYLFSLPLFSIGVYMNCCSYKLTFLRHFGSILLDCCSSGTDDFLVAAAFCVVVEVTVAVAVIS